MFRRCVMATPAEVSGLQLCVLRALEQIDCALDMGDRRAFRVWCGRRASLTKRLETLLVSIATATD